MTDLGKRAIPKLSENFYVIWMLLGWHTRRHAGGAGECPNQWGQSIKESAVEVEKALAFPGIILYGVALFALEDFIRSEKERKVYRTLTAFGLTPWIALHLFYIMILYIFSWLSTDSYAEAALPLGEALFAHFSWVPLVSEILMLPPFLYWFYLQIMLAWNLCGKRDAGQEKQEAEDKAENRWKGKENRMMKIPL